MSADILANVITQMRYVSQVILSMIMSITTKIMCIFFIVVVVVGTLITGSVHWH